MQINLQRSRHPAARSFLWAASLWLTLTLSAFCAEPPLQLTSEDMVAVRADNAWEDIEPDTVHFSGNFEMRTRTWQLTADKAVLLGKLDRPDHVELTGSPARIEIYRTVAGRQEPVEGVAQRIVYKRAENSLVFSGKARLTQGNNAMQSEIIEYDIKTDRFLTQGKTGVELEVKD